jgi:outer membrane lipoprotein-sorting protein
MTSTRVWDRAGALPVPASDGRRRAELPALPADRLPSVAELFTFMRDAESRFGTLRLRIEEMTAGTSGESRSAMELVLRHPGQARVTTTEPDTDLAGPYEIWISDGESVRTYASAHRLGTTRPVRRRVVGLGDPDLPATSKVYVPVTPLPMETLVETFVHPAGFCQNVLATGTCQVTGTDVAAGREAVLLVCDHPRATELPAERPDYRLDLAVDRDTGIIVRLVESVADHVARLAEVTILQPDAVLPPSTFDFEFPEGTTFIY